MYTHSCTHTQTLTHNDKFRPNHVMIELIVTFLVRLALTTCENISTLFLSQRYALYCVCVCV
jgi:hypothetical protein